MKEWLWTFIILGGILLFLTLLPLAVVIVFLLGLYFTSYLVSKYLVKKDKHGQKYNGKSYRRNSSR